MINALPRIAVLACLAGLAAYQSQTGGQAVPGSGGPAVPRPGGPAVPRPWAGLEFREVVTTTPVINLSFRSDGAKKWAPEIREAILGGETVISGGVNGFSKDEAEQLAAQLDPR